MSTQKRDNVTRYLSANERANRSMLKALEMARSKQGFILKRHTGKA